MQTDRHQSFVEGMGLFFEAEGAPRIAGRLFAYLLLQDEPRSLDDLVRALQVSKASISTNARLLEQRGLIERTTRPGDRRDYYVAAADQTRSIELRLEGVRQMGRLLATGLDSLSRRRSPARERLERMIEMNTLVSDWLDNLLYRWRGGRSAG